MGTNMKLLHNKCCHAQIIIFTVIKENKTCYRIVKMCAFYSTSPVNFKCIKQ